jgi:hypothetical protein
VARLKGRNGTLLTNAGGDDYYEFFFSITSTTLFTAASLNTGAAAPDGALMFNVDDIITVPEPELLVGLALGVAWLAVASRGRRSRLRS